MRGERLAPVLLLGALAVPGYSQRLPNAGDGWVLEAAASVIGRQCTGGRQNALEHECLAAVQEAAQRDGLEVAGLTIVSDGEDTAVPPGCSWSPVSKQAMFNANPNGAERRRDCTDGESCYRLVCTVERQAASVRRDRDRGQDRDRDMTMQPQTASAITDDCAPRIMQVHHKSGTQMVGAAVKAINYVIRHRLNGSCLVHVDENCFYADCPLPSSARVVHIVRNPYDMIVSGYLYHRDGGEGWDSSWLGRSMVQPDTTRSALDMASQVYMCSELIQGKSSVTQKGVCHPGGAKGVFSQGVLDVVEAARDKRFGGAIPPPLDEQENYTAFLQRVTPKAGLLSEVIASRASRSTMMGLYKRYRKLSGACGNVNFDFEGFQTAGMDGCTARWRDVIAAFDYPPKVQEDMATAAAQASCMAATDVQRSAQAHSTSDDQGELAGVLRLIDEELLGGQLGAELAELSDSCGNTHRDEKIHLREKGNGGANLGTPLRDCHADRCTDAHWEAKTGQGCSNLLADHLDSDAARLLFDVFGNLARDVCCQFCGQSAP